MLIKMPSPPEKLTGRATHIIVSVGLVYGGWLNAGEMGKLIFLIVMDPGVVI
jgi:hypothetical protein